MADSDHSRTLPAVTRGDFLLSVAGCLPDFPTDDLRIDAAPDAPLLALWREWFAARALAVEASRHQQALETKLFAIADPHARETEAWEAAAGETGHAAALEAEEHAFDAEGALAEELWAMPAGTVTGAIARLHAVLVCGQPSPTYEEFPWPQLRAVLTDLLTHELGPPADDGSNGLDLPPAWQDAGRRRTG